MTCFTSQQYHVCRLFDPVALFVNLFAFCGAGYRTEGLYMFGKCSPTELPLHPCDFKLESHFGVLNFLYKNAKMKNDISFQMNFL
jgi:hypothetical protein